MRQDAADVGEDVGQGVSILIRPVGGMRRTSLGIRLLLPRFDPRARADGLRLLATRDGVPHTATYVTAMSSQMVTEGPLGSSPTSMTC